MHDSDQEAIPLMPADEYVHDFHSGVVHVNARPFKDQDAYPAYRTRWSRWAIFVSLTCLVTLLSLLSNTILFARSWRPPATSSKLDVSKLRRPSQYLGLENVPDILRALAMDPSHPHTSPPASTLPKGTRPGWPSALARVNSAYPDHTFLQDGWVFLTEQDHTIIEFAPIPDVRVGQHCAFAAYFPERRALQDKLLTIERDDGLSNDPVIRLIPLLSSPNYFNQLTWNTRPPPVQASATPITVTAAFGHNQTSTTFACPLESSLTVEAMCIGGNCRVEYNADPDLVNVEPLLGIQLVVVS